MANSYPKRTTGAPRIELIAQDFEDQIEDQGTRVRITPSILCPVRTTTSKHAADTNHNLNCPICSGSEIVDISSQAVEDWVYIQSVKIDKNFQQQGVYDMKDAFMTVRRDVRVGYFFKIEVIDHASVFNELILRSGDSTDRLRYPLSDLDDGHIFVLLDKDGTEYIKDVDFTVSGQTLTWLDLNTSPAKDTLFSFLYSIVPTFRILELMHENRFYYDGFKKPEKTPIQLPQQCHIRWDYMAKREGSDVPN
jgi:hypothetical protein